MNHETSLLCESVQEMTLYAWPIIWNDNKYDQDSREVLITIREWGEEFEEWWMSHDENWRDRMDYLEEIQIFASRKCKEYLKEIGADEPEAPTKEKIYEVRLEVNLSHDITVKASSEAEAAELAIKKSADIEASDWFGWDNGVYVDSVNEI